MRPAAQCRLDLVPRRGVGAGAAGGLGVLAHRPAVLGDRVLGVEAPEGEHVLQEELDGAVEAGGVASLHARSRARGENLAPASCRQTVYMKTTTIRVPAETRDRLNELARRRGAPAGEVVTALVREADDRALLADAEQGWQRLSADAASLAACRAETRDLESFDAALPDS
jgi:predicted DNA-binding protein